jgi:hypothetical protein
VPAQQLLGPVGAAADVLAVLEADGGLGVDDVDVAELCERTERLAPLAAALAGAGAQAGPDQVLLTGQPPAPAGPLARTVVSVVERAAVVPVPATAESARPIPPTVTTTPAAAEERMRSRREICTASI